MIVGELDSNTAAGAVQAVATVIAVVIGYGLSSLSERKTRRAMQDAADRERRLSTVIAVVDVLEEVRGDAGAIQEVLLPLDLGLELSTPTGKAKRDADLSAAARVIEPMTAQIRLAERQLGRHALAVRVLGFDQAMIDESDRAVELVHTVVTAISGASADVGTSVTDVLTGSLPELEIIIGRFIDMGRQIK